MRNISDSHPFPRSLIFPLTVCLTERYSLDALSFYAFLGLSNFCMVTLRCYKVLLDSLGSSPSTQQPAVSSSGPSLNSLMSTSLSGSGSTLVPTMEGSGSPLVSTMVGPSSPQVSSPVVGHLPPLANIMSPLFQVRMRIIHILDAYLLKYNILHITLDTYPTHSLAIDRTI